ncbi:hypothetical protein [Vibrio pectenicida]|uniref:Uncharacterized protein n=1 Tax=Vibrio pectenicida TaxID=62763 RepID=A0A3R9FMA7_9VIBR|nr:hypothetical protein [Vibrio pectenicida]RSD31285.1 hypothetical protein EJA03_09440 [Vibrio pectenicida]
MEARNGSSQLPLFKNSDVSTLNPKLALHDDNTQVGEVLVNVKAINKVIGLSMPVSCQVKFGGESRVQSSLDQSIKKLI